MFDVVSFKIIIVSVTELYFFPMINGIIYFLALSYNLLKRVQIIDFIMKMKLDSSNIYQKGVDS